MKRLDGRQTFITLTQRVAADHGLTLTRVEASDVLWEWTAFPFSKPEDLHRQLVDLFAEVAA